MPKRTMTILVYQGVDFFAAIQTNDKELDSCMKQLKDLNSLEIFSFTVQYNSPLSYVLRNMEAENKKEMDLWIVDDERSH